MSSSAAAKHLRNLPPGCTPEEYLKFAVKEMKEGLVNSEHESSALKSANLPHSISRHPAIAIEHRSIAADDEEHKLLKHSPTKRELLFVCLCKDFEWDGPVFLDDAHTHSKVPYCYKYVANIDEETDEEAKLTQKSAREKCRAYSSQGDGGPSDLASVHSSDENHDLKSALAILSTASTS
ncbi:unnamed protein product [Gongylonema pulchrum]|uniref:Uncharacterized protein n=1 Tax=Gongylonema pulchrum TaxID=637853 RepID=A0A3P6PE24_9BILA|nr:unnamed protein product [Gongylonema pulchrum]